MKDSPWFNQDETQHFHNSEHNRTLQAVTVEEYQARIVDESLCDNVAGRLYLDLVGVDLLWF